MGMPIKIVNEWIKQRMLWGWVINTEQNRWGTARILLSHFANWNFARAHADLSIFPVFVHHIFLHHQKYKESILKASRSSIGIRYKSERFTTNACHRSKNIYAYMRFIHGRKYYLSLIECHISWPRGFSFDVANSIVEVCIMKASFVSNSTCTSFKWIPTKKQTTQYLRQVIIRDSCRYPTCDP